MDIIYEFKILPFVKRLKKLYLYVLLTIILTVVIFISKYIYGNFNSGILLFILLSFYFWILSYFAAYKKLSKVTIDNEIIRIDYYIRDNLNEISFSKEQINDIKSYELWMGVHRVKVIVNKEVLLNFISFADQIDINKLKFKLNQNGCRLNSVDKNKGYYLKLENGDDDIGEI